MEPAGAILKKTAFTTKFVSSLTRYSVTHLQAQELDGSATLQVDFRHVESTDAELAGLIQQHHYRIELGLRQVAAVPDHLQHA